MGWRSTGAAFRAGNYNGPLTSDEGGFASGFAKTFTAGISKASDIIAGEMQAQRDQKREEDLIRLRETLAAQRAAATSSRASNKESAKQLKEAQAFAAENDVSLEESLTILQANDWNGRLAGVALNKDRKTGKRVDSSTLQYIQTPTDDTSTVTPAPAANPAIVPEVAPTVETSSLTDNLLETEDEAGQVLSDTQPVSDAVQLAGRGDTRTDVPLLNSNDPETPLVEQADAVVAELAAKPPAPNAAPITYEDRVAAGETPTAAATLIGAGIIRVPEMFELPDLTTITSLDQALAIRDVLEARRGFLQGATDDFYRNYAPVLEQRIRSLSVQGLPDLGDMAQQNNRDQLQEFATNGWRTFEGTVDPDTLNNHRRRAEELLSSGITMPNIPEGVAELRAMNRDVLGGVYGANIPTEWQGQLNSALAEAEFRSSVGNNLTTDFIFNDDLTIRELTGFLNSAMNLLPSGDPIILNLQEALRLRDKMPDKVDLPKLADVRANNFQALAAEASRLGDTAFAEQINVVGQRMANTDPEGRQAISDAIDSAADRLNVINTRVGEAQNLQNSYLSAASSAYNIIGILAVEPDILTVAGGQVPAWLAGVDNQIGALVDVIGEISEGANSVTSAEQRIAAYERSINEDRIQGRIPERAAAYARYKAQETRLAFMIVRLQQPSGQITQPDFDSALRQVRSSSLSENVEDSLRDLIQQDLINVTSAQDGLATDPQVIASNRILANAGINDLDLLGGVLRPIEEIANARGAGEAISWLSGKTTLVPRGNNQTDAGPEIVIVEETDEFITYTDGTSTWRRRKNSQ